MTAVATPAAVTIRPYTDADRAQVREIACRTAFRGRGHALLLDDAELFADYWTRYYTDYEPECAMVAEREERVVGYLLGCLDTDRFQRTMARLIVPTLTARLVIRLARSHAPERRRIVRVVHWMMTRAWREAPDIDRERYPAHYHCNLLRAAHGSNAYTSLAGRFVAHAARSAAPGMHGQVFDRRDGGVWQALVCDFRIAHPEVTVVASERESSMGRALLADDRPMVNRAFATTLDGYATFLEWLRRWRHL